MDIDMTDIDFSKDIPEPQYLRKTVEGDRIRYCVDKPTIEPILATQRIKERYQPKIALPGTTVFGSKLLADNIRHCTVIGGINDQTGGVTHITPGYAELMYAHGRRLPSPEEQIEELMRELKPINVFVVNGDATPHIEDILAQYNIRAKTIVPPTHAQKDIFLNGTQVNIYTRRQIEAPGFLQTKNTYRMNLR